jgi:hypothetical protein
VDNPKYGRKKGLLTCYILCSVVSLLVYCLKDSELLFFTLIGFVKFLISYCFGVIYPFTAELYLTSLRSAGTGLHNCVCRLGGVVMPWITFWFFKFGEKGPFLSFFIISAISAFSAYTI